MRASLQTEAGNATESARRRLLSRRWEPLFFADWARAVFMHYEVEARALQHDVPFSLDLHEGRAYVSLVAFTLRRMRFRFGGRLGEWLCRPVATHEFLNARTYVRHRGESGIFFLREWLPNPLCVCLGPLTFGLPYRLGSMNYQNHHETGTLRGSVSVRRTKNGLRYEGEIDRDASLKNCVSGSRDEFLLERYTAFTGHHSQRRFFRIWHQPWLQTPVHVSVTDQSLVASTWTWFKDAKFVGANYSPGLQDVWMGWPHRADS